MRNELVPVDMAPQPRARGGAHHRRVPSPRAIRTPSPPGCVAGLPACQCSSMEHGQALAATSARMDTVDASAAMHHRVRGLRVSVLPSPRAPGATVGI